MSPEVKKNISTNENRNEKQSSKVPERMELIKTDNGPTAASKMLLDCLDVWRYHDFVFEKIGEGFFGTVFKVSCETMMNNIFAKYSEFACKGNWLLFICCLKLPATLVSLFLFPQPLNARGVFANSIIPCKKAKGIIRCGHIERKDQGHTA